MNYDESQPIITEKKSYLTFLLILLALLVLTIFLYKGYVQYQNKKNIESIVVEETVISSIGLNSPLQTTNTPSGNIYFSAAFASTSQSEPLSYKFNVASNSLDLLSDQTLLNAIPLSSSSFVAILSNDQYGATDSYQPHRIDKITKLSTVLPNVLGHGVTDLTVSPDGTRYAYSFQKEDMRGVSEPQLLSQWHIALHEFNSERVLLIEGGSKPKWVNNGTHVLYMTEMGLTLYEVATGNTQLVFETYAPFTSFDGIAVAPDSTHVVLTKANVSMISVLNFKQELDRTTLIENGRIISEDTTYYNPVISPDSKFYVTTAEKINNFNLSIEKMTYTYSNSYALEIRQIDNAAVLEALPLNDVGTSTVSISNWASL